MLERAGGPRRHAQSLGQIGDSWEACSERWKAFRALWRTLQSLARPPAGARPHGWALGVLECALECTGERWEVSRLQVEAPRASESALGGPAEDLGWSGGRLAACSVNWEAFTAP